MGITQRKLGRLPRKTILNSDAITGERLDYGPGIVHRPVQAHDRIFYPHTPEHLNGYRVSIPLRLHTRTPDAMGAPSWSRTLTKYYASSIPTAPTSDNEYALRFWWTPVWAERELFAHFPHDVVDMVLSVRRDQKPWDYAIIGSRRSISECVMLMREMQIHCQRLIRQEAQQQAA